MGCSQTASERKVDNSDFRLAGIHTDLGTFKDTIHGKDDKKTFSISFGLPGPKGDKNLVLEYVYKKGQRLISASVAGVNAFSNDKLIFSAREAFKNQEQFNFHGHGQVLSHSKFEVGDDVDNDDENHEDEVPEIIRQMDELFSNYLKKEQEKLPQEQETRKQVIIDDLYLRVLDFAPKKGKWFTLKEKHSREASRIRYPKWK